MKKASLIFLRNQDKVLLVLRDNKKSIPYPNYWALFGGNIEENETPKMTILREVKEEIGYNVKNIKFIKKMEITDDPLCENRVLYIFQGNINKRLDELNLTEGQKINYFSFKEFKKLKFTGFLQDFIIKNKNEFF